MNKIAVLLCAIIAYSPLYALKVHVMNKRKDKVTVIFNSDKSGSACNDVRHEIAPNATQDIIGPTNSSGQCWVREIKFDFGPNQFPDGITKETLDATIKKNGTGDRSDGYISVEIKDAPQGIESINPNHHPGEGIVGEVK